MADLETNARRMVHCFAQMRELGAGPALAKMKLFNLSFSHMRTIGLLSHEGSLTMKELAERLQITPPSVTILTRRLVQTGLVRRTTHAQDNRVTLLSLTDEGREWYNQLTNEHTRRMAQLLQALSDEEQTQFLNLLERAVRTMAAAAPPINESSQADN